MATNEMVHLGRAGPALLSLHGLPLLLRGCNRGRTPDLGVPQKARAASVALSSPNIFLAEGALGCFHRHAFPISIDIHTLLKEPKPCTWPPGGSGTVAHRCRSNSTRSTRFSRSCQSLRVLVARVLRSLLSPFRVRLPLGGAVSALASNVAAGPSRRVVD